ncbi:MAG: metallophosphoesterase [Terracidiphilus sp.]
MGMLKTGRLCALVPGCVLALIFQVFPENAPAQAASESGAKTIEALFVSDIHFEPFLDPGKAAQLAAAPVGEWDTILAAPASADAAAQWTKLGQACPTRGADTSYALYHSSLHAIHAQASGAKFVIVSGDLIAHNFSCKFAAVFPKAAAADYRAFVEKTIAYVLADLRSALPGVPVYAALGNNDSDCGDYQLDANSAFLKESGQVFASDLQGAEQAQALETFAAGGYYSVSLPAPVENARLLVLDDLFMSERYETCGGKEDHAPAAAQIAWLTHKLDEARDKKEKIWVMAHIPPGVDSYSTAKKWMDLCSGGKPKFFLASEEFPEVLARYGDVIQLAIFAHTHMDEVRLLMPAKGAVEQKPVGVKMVASISPVDGNNPSFTLATVDPARAILMDYRVIAASNQTGIDTAWSEEYDFAKTYHEPAFTAVPLSRLIAGFKTDPTAQSSASQSYLRYYMTGVDMRGLALIWQPYVCSLKNGSNDAYRECVCSSVR